MRNRKLALLITLAFSFLLCTACAPRLKSFSKTIFTMDTVMTLTAYGERAQEAIEASVTRLFELDALLSVTREESEIARLNAANGADVRVSQEVYDLIGIAVDYSKQFSGYFDITISPVVSLWGFYTDTFRVPNKAELEAVMTSVDYRNVVLKEDLTVALQNGAQIDLGGIAKGYAADVVREILTAYEIDSAILDLGGNVLAFGFKADGSGWNVLVRDPFETGSQLCLLSVSDKALVTSGSYQRYFEENGVRYHHIMNPETGRPAESDLVSVTVITDEATYADALSTALFVMGYEQAVKYWREKGDFEAIFVMSGGNVFLTQGAMDLLETADESFQAVK